MDNKNIASLAAVSSLLAACGGGGSNNGGDSSSGGSTGGTGTGSGGSTGGTGVGVAVYTKPATQAEAARFLLQTQFNTNSTEINSLLTSTYANYLTAQFAIPISTTGWDWLNSKGFNAIDNYAYFDNTYPGDYMMWQQLLSSPDGFRKKISLALSEMFVVSLVGLNMSWRAHAAAAWWDLINANCFTTFRQLFGAVTLNAAMGNYLNLAGSSKENSAGREPDENYARECMQLFSLGLYQLNIDGSTKTDSSGNGIYSYTQDDVTNLARAFTGWNYDYSKNVPTSIVINGTTRNVPNTSYVQLPMVLNASNHSTLAATFLGTSLPTDGASALTTALDTICNHPNVGPFFAIQMIKKLVTSNPSTAYIKRVATVFNDNGSGVRGDLKAVFSAIFLDSEARDLTNINVASFGKVKEPMHRFIQWARTFKLTSKYGYWKLGNKTSNFGQSPLQSPSVFNFFRPNYVPPSTQLATLNLTAPEFQIVNESTVSSYINFMQNTIKSGIYVSGPDFPYFVSNANNGYDITPDYTEALTYVTQSSSLVDYLDLMLNASLTSSANKALIVSALDSFGVTTTSNSTVSLQLNKLAAAILLIMSSSDYIIQK